MEDDDSAADVGVLTCRGADASRPPKQFAERKPGGFDLAITEKDERIGIRANSGPVFQHGANRLGHVCYPWW